LTARATGYRGAPPVRTFIASDTVLSRPEGLMSPKLLPALLILSAGCASAPPAPPELAPGVGVVGANSAEVIAQADRAAAAYTQADVDFMSGMIPHHAQAVKMSEWCATHGARSDVQVLCSRIVIAQKDEIRMMRRWLGERGQVVPDSLALRHVMRMGDTVHEIMMPGMLTDEQMSAIDAARGSEFDYLFLTGMIGHHRGAIQMVNELFAQPSSGLEETVFRFANDVVSDQTAEIQRMLIMLETVPR
jgi:uncharacterized protein (DUF305 family)